MSLKVIKGLYSNKDDVTKHEVATTEQLSKINNYFELTYSNKPSRVFIDLDGKLSDKNLKKCDKEMFSSINNDIIKKLCKLENVSVMSSSSYSHNKLSYRITYINEYCDDMASVKETVKMEKYPEIKHKLRHKILVCDDKQLDALNVDYSVYRDGKMRCVNAWKTDDDITRINKLEKGNIIDTFINYIPANAIKRLSEKTKEPTNIIVSSNDNNNVIEDIKMKALKMKGCFDSYNNWLELCFILHNETNGTQEGKKAFIEICKEMCKKFDEEECNKKWYSVKSVKEKKITLGTLNKKYYEMFPEEKDKDKQEKEKDKQKTIYNNKNYIDQKIKFEERIFKLDNPFYFVKINSNNTLEFMNEKTLQSWAKGEYTSIIYNDKEIPFINVWLEDPNKLKKNNIIFDPSIINDKENYNCWKGFNFDETIEAVKEEESKFLSLLKKLVNDDVNYEYVKQWIAHIIQKPYMKTNVAIVLYSDIKGAGKNCIIDGISKLLNNYTAKVGGIEDIVKNFNAHLVNKLFISGDEICAKAKAVSDKLKETITRTTQNLEKKGKDSIQINDYTNWLFTTNNYDAFKIENGDRRMNMIHCKEEKFKESLEFYKEINNPLEINKLFNYFKSYNITYRIGIDEPPLTKYKQQLQYNNKEGYIQMLYKEPCQFANNSLSSTEILKIMNDYSKHNYLPQCHDIVSFGKFMTNLFNNFKKRGNTGFVFNFNNVDKNKFNEILYKYDPSYWKYINHYQENEEPDFKNLSI
jgi:hypothetical protein